MKNKIIYHGSKEIIEKPSSSEMSKPIYTKKTKVYINPSVQHANLYINGRIFLIYAIALKRAKEMWNQSYDETIAQLEIPESYRDHIITFADQVDENLNV